MRVNFASVTSAGAGVFCWKDNSTNTELAHEKVSGVSWVTRSWFLKKEIAVEVFKCIFCCLEHHKLRVIESSLPSSPVTVLQCDHMLTSVNMLTVLSSQCYIITRAFSGSGVWPLPYFFNPSPLMLCTLHICWSAHVCIFVTASCTVVMPLHWLVVASIIVSRSVSEHIFKQSNTHTQTHTQSRGEQYQPERQCGIV